MKRSDFHKLTTGLALSLTVLFATGAFAQQTGGRSPANAPTITNETKEAISILKDRGVMIGYPGDRFAGERSITRIEATLAIWRLRQSAAKRFGKVYSHQPAEAFLAVFSPAQSVTLVNSERFKDVEPPCFGPNFTFDLQESGVVHGYPGDYFKRKRILSRGELAALVARLLQRSERKPKFDIQQANFKDVAGDEWWFGPMLATTGSGVMRGFPDHTFRSKRFVTRSEFAITLARLVKLTEPAEKER